MSGIDNYLEKKCRHMQINFGDRLTYYSNKSGKELIVKGDAILVAHGEIWVQEDEDENKQRWTYRIRAIQIIAVNGVDCKQQN
jgi:hypothetical protein